MWQKEKSYIESIVHKYFNNLNFEIEFQEKTAHMLCVIYEPKDDDFFEEFKQYFDGWKIFKNEDIVIKISLSKDA